MNRRIETFIPWRLQAQIGNRDEETIQQGFKWMETGGERLTLRRATSLRYQDRLELADCSQFHWPSFLQEEPSRLSKIDSEGPCKVSGAKRSYLDPLSLNNVPYPEDQGRLGKKARVLLNSPTLPEPSDERIKPPFHRLAVALETRPIGTVPEQDALEPGRFQDLFEYLRSTTHRRQSVWQPERDDHCL